MTKDKLEIGDHIQSDSGKLAFVDKIYKDKIRVLIDGERDYILDCQLSHWTYANPIKDNRLVSSKTFAVRFKQFLEWIPEKWITSQIHYMEEYDYMLLIANQLLNYQIQTANNEEEINYLKRLIRIMIFGNKLTKIWIQ